MSILIGLVAFIWLVIAPALVLALGHAPWWAWLMVASGLASGVFMGWATTR